MIVPLLLFCVVLVINRDVAVVAPAVVVLVSWAVDGDSARGAGVAADDAAEGQAGQGARAAVGCRRVQSQQARCLEREGRAEGGREGEF